jgi:hypothetical protein
VDPGCFQDPNQARPGGSIDDAVAASYRSDRWDGIDAILGLLQEIISKRQFIDSTRDGGRRKGNSALNSSMKGGMLPTSAPEYFPSAAVPIGNIRSKH